MGVLTKPMSWLITRMTLGLQAAVKIASVLVQQFTNIPSVTVTQSEAVEQQLPDNCV